MVYTAMAYIAMASIFMAHMGIWARICINRCNPLATSIWLGMAVIVMAYTFIIYIVMACKIMAYVVMAYIVSPYGYDLNVPM